MSDRRGMDAAEALNRIARAVEEAAAKVVAEWRESNAGEQTTEADDTDLLTAEEREALDLSGQLANLCRRIVGSGPQAGRDWNELATRIHAVQHTIMAQAAARAYPGQFRLLGGEVARQERP